MCIRPVRTTGKASPIGPDAAGSPTSNPCQPWKLSGRYWPVATEVEVSSLPMICGTSLRCRGVRLRCGPTGASGFIRVMDRQSSSRKPGVSRRKAFAGANKFHLHARNWVPSHCSTTSTFVKRSPTTGPGVRRRRSKQRTPKRLSPWGSSNGASRPCSRPCSTTPLSDRSARRRFWISWRSTSIPWPPGFSSTRRKTSSGIWRTWKSSRARRRPPANLS